MPSKSKAQHNLMAMVAHDPKAAKRVGIKQSVGEEFMKADKGRKFAKGGMTRHEDEAMDKKMIKKAMGMHDKQMHGGKKTNMSKLKKGGCVKKMADGGDVEGFDWASLKVKPREETITERMPARKMDQGERPRMVRKTGANWTNMRFSGEKSALPEEQKGMGMKKGGSVSSASKRADGCATKGKTKGTMVKMCGGGYAKKGK